MKQKKHILFLIFSLCFFSFLFADNFRVANMNQIDFDQSYDAISTNLGINEALCIKFPKDKTFLEGFEIEIKIPKIIATYRDSVIYSFYSNISPNPQSNIIDYSGYKLFTDTIPPRLSVAFQVFLDNINQPKTSPYSTLLPFVIEENQNELVIRFQLAMKGVPESFFTSEFTVSVKPILKNEGLLALNLNYPEPQENENLENTNLALDFETAKSNNITVYIDDVIISDFSKPIFLKTGVHHVSIICENYRNEVRTVVINQAATTTLDIDLKSIDPEIILVAPEETKVFLDDTEILDVKKPVKVSAGEHSVKFVIADYELTKKVTIQNGNTYVISLSVDIKVEELSEN